MQIEDEVQKILDDFQRFWSFDGRDLERPNADQMLRERIERCGVANWKDRLKYEFFGLGPLEEVIETPELQEIIVNGPKEIWVERKGRLERHPDGFLSAVTFKGFIDRLCSEAQVKIDLSQPFADGRWRNYRLHLACAPLTDSAFHVSLRRIPHNPWSISALRDVGWASDSALRTLQELLQTRKNILFLGPTGSGKTSVLSACLRELPENERVLIIEDTDELPRPNSASTKLLSRPSCSASLGEITLAELVRQSLRMRPSRLVMGEVRGAEAKDLLLALATGHTGSLGTLHASNARQALLRLEMLVQLGAPQWNVLAIRQLIQLSVDALVVCENHAGVRKLEGIYKVAALESFGFLLEPMTSNSPAAPRVN